MVVLSAVFAAWAMLRPQFADTDKQPLKEL
jgi:hypothetical protein